MSIEIKNCPCTLAPGYNSYSYTALRRMFNNKHVGHTLDKIFIDSADEKIINTAISGNTKKTIANVEKGKIVVAQTDSQGQYIVKFAPQAFSFNYLSNIPANEHLTMQIARQIYKINTAENALVFTQPTGAPAIIVKRFDFRADGTKIKQEDFASLTLKTPERNGSRYKYIGSYSGLGIYFKSICAAWQVELSKFYKIIVFNYIFGNSDAHLKNFSFQQTKDGDYILSPFYDLVNCVLHKNTSIFALDGGLINKQYYSKFYKKTNYPCKEDFATFGKMIELNSNIVDIINEEFKNLKDDVFGLIRRSFLDEKLKKRYADIYKQRTAYFNKER